VPTSLETITTLGQFNGTNGSQPQGGLVVAGGDLFGTANLGGAFGKGTVFQVLSGSRTVTTLASFDGTNGAYPRAGLVEDTGGNLYGAAYQGGDFDQGTVFMAQKGKSTITVLAVFNGTNGANPSGGVIVDGVGNLFGTTSNGGASNSGTVFEVVHDSGTVTTLATFDGGGGGGNPIAGVIEDGSGNLFGTTSTGGEFGAGTVFEVVSGSGKITTLASFNSSSPLFPNGLVEDASGNLFGTTYQGGDSSNNGMVFEVEKGNGVITPIASFTGANGSLPQGGLIMDASGDLFGTTSGGGDFDSGTVFVVFRGSNTITTVASFDPSSDGSNPLGNLAMDSSGNLYGTTFFGGGSDAGTVFEVPPPPIMITMMSTLPSWTVNQPGYSQTIGTSGGAGGNTFSASGGLPPGLSLSPGGVISGTPTAVGSYNFTVTVTDSMGGTASHAFTITINIAVHVATTTLPSWTVNQPGYNQTVSASGGTGTLTFSSSGAIPTGLTLSTSGVLSGTPRVVGTFTFTITATDSIGASSSQTYAVTIGSSVAITTTSLPDWTIKAGYNQTITATGGTGSLTLSQSAGTLPPGLALSSSGILSGTPSTAGTFSFTVTATDSLGATAIRSFTVTMNPRVTLRTDPLPPGAIGKAYNQTIAAGGGTGSKTLSVAVISGSVPGVTIPSTGTNAIVISGTPTGPGIETFTVTATDSIGASIAESYTLTVTSPIAFSPTSLPADTVNVAYNQTITTSGGTGTVTLTVSGIIGSIPGLTIPSSGSNSLAITGTPTASGTVSFTVTATDPGGDTSTNNYSITVNPVLSLTPGSLPQDTISTVYNQTITAGGGTGSVTLSVSGVMGAIPGLTVPSSGTGSLIISGTPTATGTETFTVTATDSLGATTATMYSITVNPGLIISPGSLPADTVGVPYNQTIVASGGTGTVTLTVSGVSGAITGLNVPVSGTGSLSITGTPSAAGTETFTVTATDAAGASTSIPYTIVVNRIVTLTPSILPVGTANTAYNQTLTATGGTGTVTLSVSGVTGSIPGLSVPSSGSGSLSIAGTPTAPGSISFTVTATDSVGATASTSYTLNITAATAFLSMPTSGFSASTNSILANFPIFISQLSDGTHVGLATASLVLDYPAGVFDFPLGSGDATSYVSLGTVPLSDTAGGGGAGDWILTANTPFDGELRISLVAQPGDNITKNTGGGSLVTINFPIDGAAPLGDVTLTLINNASGHTQVIGNNGLYALSPPPPYNGTITISSLGSLSISPSTLPASDVNTAYNETIAASAGIAPFTYAVTSGTLPNGLTLDASSGVLSGTPKATGSYTFTLKASDSRGATSSQSYTFLVNPAPALATSVFPAASAGTVYSATITTSGGTAPFTFSVPPGNLPPGLSLSTDGILSGTPTNAGNFAFTVSAVDAAGAHVARTYSLTVNAGPASEYLVSVPGSSTVQAGSNFLVVVQAADQYGNPVTSGYSGPATVVPSLSPSISASVLPDSVPINSRGVGLFLVTLDQVGTFTISVGSGSLTGSANPVTVVSGPAAKLGFVGKPADTPTGVGLSPVRVQVQDLYGNLVTSDNTDVMTLAVGNGPGQFTTGSTLTAPVVNGVALFNNLTLVKPGSYQLSAVVPSLYTGPYSPTFTVKPLQVVTGSLVGTPSGFTVQFNAPYLVNSTTPVLYGTGSTTAPVPSVIVTTDPGHPGNRAAYVAGSLILSPFTNSLTFLATNTTLESNNNSPLLPDGTYTVIIHGTAAKNGFQALNSGGGFLDGLGTGVAGSGDFVGTFTVTSAAQHADVVWVPGTAIGPGQALVAPGMNQAGGGYPIYLADGTGTVTDVKLTLNYDPALLNLTGVTGANFTLLGTSAPGRAVLEYSGPALPTGSQTPIGFIQATVPAGTAANPVPYRAKDLLHLTGVSVNGGATPAVTSDGLHLVAYVGDANGDGAYSSDDAVKVTRVLLQADTGFAAYPLVDPVIVADTDGSGFVPSDAALQVNEAGVGVATLTLANPPIPTGTHLQPVANNVDPSVSIPAYFLVRDNGTVTVPVNIDDPHPAGSTGLIEAHLALSYDPNVFAVSGADVHLGSVLAAGSGWSVTPTINPVTGQIAIALSSDTPIRSTLGGSLVTIDFHARTGQAGLAGAPSQASALVALVASVNPTGQQIVSTELEDAQGTFTLTPAPQGDFDATVASLVMPPFGSGVDPIQRDERLSTTDRTARVEVADTTNQSTNAAMPEASSATVFAAPDSSADPGWLHSNGTIAHAAVAMARISFIASSVDLGPAGLASGLAQAFGISPAVSAFLALPHSVDPWFQALARTTMNAIDPAFLASTARDVLALGSQPRWSPDMDNQRDALDGIAVSPMDALPAPSARRSDRRAETAAVAEISSRPCANQEALDRYFAQAADGDDQSLDEPDGI
jgi:uncharacterized repeat protein (TIGR03803 family)